MTQPSAQLLTLTRAISSLHGGLRRLVLTGLQALLLGSAFASSGVHGAPAAREPAPLYKQVRDWLLVCDNTRRCDARALVENAPAIMSIEREAGPNTPATIRIRGRGLLQAENLTLDGDPGSLRTLAWQSDQTVDGTSSVLALSAEPARAVIDMLLKGQTLGLGAPAKDAVISLSGITAALLAMDEWQGRLDTPGALVRTGPLLETRVHRAWPMPVIPRRAMSAPNADRALIAPVRAARQYSLDDECDGGPKAPRDRIVGLTDAEVLVFLECRRGAYQSSFIPLRVRRDAPHDPHRLILPWPESAFAFGAEKDFEPVYEPATGMLTMTGRGRGVGDCGFLAEWQFNGKEFDLTRYSEQRICAGLAMDWPVHYRTETHR
ncbi:MAG: DUF1176 domain-containing protein [Burkholderiaceae bacterium]